jgi:acyl carrier protein/RimJ/RimL family protein N-acetyltransferase
MSASDSNSEILQGTHVQLRPIVPNDLEFLYQISVAPENGYRWRYRGAVPTRSMFAEALDKGILVQFVVERSATSEPVGLVTAYGANLRDEWTYVAAVTAPKFVQSGAVLDGLINLIGYLFRNWPFRKIYFETIEFNLSQFGSAIGVLAAEEGRLKDHVFYDGRYWDVVTGAIYRDSWHKSIPSLLPAVGTSLQAQLPESLSIDDFKHHLVQEMDCIDGDIDNDDLLFEDLGLDSLNMVELGAIIESLAGPVRFEMLGEITTVREAYAWYCTSQSMPLLDQTT